MPKLLPHHCLHHNIQLAITWHKKHVRKNWMHYLGRNIVYRSFHFIYVFRDSFHDRCFQFFEWLGVIFAFCMYML